MLDLAQGLRPGRLHGGPLRLRVLLVIDSLACGGAERHVVDLARSLARAGHAVTVACSVAGPLACELDAAGVPVAPLLDRVVKRHFSPRFVHALRPLVRSGAFDVVHGHVYASATAAAGAVAGTRVPLVITEHTEAPWRDARDLAISRIAYRRADRIIAVSTAIRRLLVERFGLPAAKVAYVPNAVTPPGDTAAAVALPSGCKRAVLIGRVARLAPEKGHDVFLAAAAIVARGAPAARFLVVGDGPLAAQLPALADKLGIGDRVHFLGQRQDARDVIARLDLLVVSSISDGAPLVNLEAMAAGTPIVASACGGIPDQIRDAVEGLLVAPGDAQALAAAIGRLVDDPALARRLAGAARRRAASDFSYAAMLADVEDCYATATAPAALEEPVRRRATAVPQHVPIP